VRPRREEWGGQRAEWCGAWARAGYDDEGVISSIRLIVDFTKRTYEQYLEMEEDRTRTESLHSKQDPRVGGIPSRLHAWLAR
jgi:hypothetical protein